MSVRHVVCEGEHLALIAARAGHADPMRVLAHPDNQDLEARPHPAILDVGETLTIPDVSPKQVSLASGQAHRVVLRMPVCKLRIRLMTFRGDLAGQLGAELSVDGLTVVCTLDAGEVTATIPVGARSAKLRVVPADDRARELVWNLRIGHLGRAEVSDGLWQRLRNLGYYRQVTRDLRERERRSAIEEFQADQELALTGVLDATTKAKIVEVHGC